MNLGCRALIRTVAAALLVVGCDSDSSIAPDESPVVIAHRGASYSAPEHTFDAYDLALEQQADYIEQDVHRTSDGVLVVIHDAALDRTARGAPANCTGSVSSKTLAQIQTCEVGSWFNAAYPELAQNKYVGAKIPTLRDVLARYGSRARFYIEIKNPELYPGIEEDLLGVLQDAGIDAGAGGTHPKVFLQSFSAVTLQRIKALAPAWSLIQLIGNESPANIVALLGQVRQYAVGIAAPSAVITQTLVDAAHASCLIVHSYTVDDPAEMSALLSMGIDGFFTNRSDVGVVAAKSRSATPLPAHC